jgi:hypothetical protein
MKPSGLTYIDIDAHPKEVWRFLCPVDPVTGQEMRDPDYPDKVIAARAVNTVEGWVKHSARDSGSGALLHANGEIKSKVTKTSVELWWTDDAPQWAIDTYSNLTTDELLSKFAPGDGTKWKHHKSGAIYKVLFLTNLPDDERYPKTVVYENTHNGSRWSRPVSDWHRSFTPVSD